MIDCHIYLLGDDAVAIRPKDKASRHGIAQSLRSGGDWLDVVSGKEIVAVQFNPLHVAPSEAMKRLDIWRKDYSGASGEAREPITLHLDTSEVNAPDLMRLAQQNGLSTQALLQKIVRSSLIVDMLGFTPGFAYVEGVDPELVAERLSVPRQKVSAGSVGLLSGQLGLYALAGPGGWPIIGRLQEKLFDPDRDQPFLLQAGQPIVLKLVDQPK